MRRRHRRTQRTAELDITAFLNLMIVLVPVLLLSMVFTQTRAIGLNFPDQGASAEGADVEQLQIRVTLSGGDILVGDNRDGLIERIEPGPEGPDYTALTEALKRIKARVPEKRDIALLATPDTEYQQLVSAMDAIRSYPAVVAASVVQAELFPDIALGDAPAFAVEDGEGQ
jgi:biopolymer transport protein ExbD